MQKRIPEEIEFQKSFKSNESIKDSLQSSFKSLHNNSLEQDLINQKLQIEFLLETLENERKESQQKIKALQEINEMYKNTYKKSRNFLLNSFEVVMESKVQCARYEIELKHIKESKSQGSSPIKIYMKDRCCSPMSIFGKENKKDTKKPEIQVENFNPLYKKTRKALLRKKQ